MSGPVSGVLDIQVSGRCWTFTLNRPEKLNALNAELVEALLQGVHQAGTEGARLLVFRGAGKGFCAGFDLSDLEAQSEGDLVLRFIRIEQLLQAVASFPAYTVALAHGKVFGAGVDLFAVCRRRVAAADSMFRMPGLKFGLVLGTRRFADLVGSQKALEILGASRPFSTDEALRMGFVQQVLAQEDWAGAVQECEALSAELEDEARASLYRALDAVQADTDLAHLVRSAAQPGLKERLRKYLGQ